MRDYPSVPNVFRVASTHSVNADTAAASGAKGVPQQQQRYNSQQQQQPTRQQINGNNGKQKIQQPQQQEHQQQQQQTYGSAHLATTSASNNIANGSVPQQSYHNNNNNNNNTSQSSSTSTMLPHKLTTTASIERNYYSASQSSGRRDQQQQQQQHQQQHHYQLQQSPYGTLPRAMPAFGNAVADHSRGGSAAHERSSAGVGVINTISGSIPATGLAVSPGSDLNVSLNNSCTDLNKLNGVHEKQQQPREFVVTRAGGAGVSQYQKRARHCTNLERTGGGGYLWILTPVAASISVAIVIAALAGPQWLFTEEKLPNANYNGTANFNALDDGAFITKYTKSSLWILCTTLQGVETYNCIKIDYFPKEGYQPDPHDSTPAIPYTVTKSCPFFLAAGIFLLISFVVFLIPTCSHQNNLYYFSAGIMFIVSGLLMLIGLIAYISILKAEIGSKLRPRSTLQPALFKVTYGQSFFLFVFGFIATEFVGLLNIFLYISLQEVGYYSRLPCFTIANLHEKIKEGEHPHSHTYKSYKHPVERKPFPRSRLNNNNNSHHQIHSVYRPPPAEMELESKKLPGFVACRKHPNGGEATAAAGLFANNNDLERRFYFERPSQSKCNLHSKNFAKSLNELYTEPAPAVAPPPPPPSAIKADGNHTLPRLQQASTQYVDLPQEFPLTRSVSTTTDIFGNGNGAAASGSAAGNSRGTTPHLERKNRRNMATNTRPCDTETNESERLRQTVAAFRRQQSNESEDTYDDEPQRLCGLKRGIRKTKDELFLEFCKRAGMRPKPKNIYFIANEEEAEQQRRRRCNGSVVSGGSGRARTESNERTNGEDDADNAGREHDMEHGFKQLQEDDEHIYVIQDNPQFLANPMRGMRRSSMYVEPTHLRKLNSNLSLTTLYPPDKFYQKSLLALERSDSAADIWPPALSTDQYHYAKNAYGGSQNRLHQDYAGAPIYQSRTLPRSFLKRSTDSQDSIASANALHSIYGSSQNRLTNLMLQQQQQQQLQQQNRFLSQSHNAGIYNSALVLHKSCEDLPATAHNNSNYRQQQQQMANAAYATAITRSQHQQQQQQHQMQQQRSAAVAVIGNGNNSNTLQQATVQWPAAIPSSPSGYAANFHQVYPLVAPTSHASHLPHAIITRSASGSAASTGCASATSAPPLMAPPKFQRAYAFDEQRRNSAAVSDAFDLDEMERERRRSHASLFSGISSLGGMSGGGNAEHYDLINGTAV